MPNSKQKLIRLTLNQRLCDVLKHALLGHVYTSLYPYEYRPLSSNVECLFAVVASAPGTIKHHPYLSLMRKALIENPAGFALIAGAILAKPSPGALKRKFVGVSPASQLNEAKRAKRHLEEWLNKINMAP